MSYNCKNCGVELEDEMNNCPLCVQNEDIIANNGFIPYSNDQLSPLFNKPRKMNKPQKKLVWEIISITILSLIIVTFSINLILSGSITWSEYPLAISLIIFSYFSFFSFLNQPTIIKVIGGFIVSSLFLLLLDALTNGGLIWAFKIGIPLLFSANVITVLLLFIFKKSKQKGINLIAYTVIAAAIFCLSIEVILSVIKTNTIHLIWSIIVIASAFPVAAVLLFVHYRLTKNHDFERTFHL